jgi:hypothetical protein
LEHYFFIQLLRLGLPWDVGVCLGPPCEEGSMGGLAGLVEVREIAFGEWKCGRIEVLCDCVVACHNATLKKSDTQKS